MAKSSSIPAPAWVWCSKVFPLSLGWLLATHWTFLDLPYHWDELGQFVPAARDLLHSGAVVPRSTLPNVHPPLLMAYLAGAWKLFGFSIPVTRVAMLMVGAATLTMVSLLGRRLSGARAGLAAAALAAVSPPFVAQGMLAHLDLAATFWVLVTLYWFLDRRWWLCAVASTALVLTKETGVIVPLVLAVVARREKRRLLPLALPMLALACWLVVLRSSTGHWLGSAEFERYNVDEALRAGRIPLVLLRRVYQVAFANFHWVATLALVAGRKALGPGWGPIGAVAGACVALHSVLGGAILLRYLLPVLALFYIATAAALEPVSRRLRRGCLAVLLAGLAVSNWWNPPYPFGYEDNLAVVDFVRLQQQAARWAGEHAGERTVTTAWPLTDALTTPWAGYVSRPVRVRAVENFQPQSWKVVEGDGLELVMLYSRSWEPKRGWQRWPPAAGMLERWFGYRPQISRQELMARFRLRSVARWERRGQWIEVFLR